MVGFRISSEKTRPCVVVFKGTMDCDRLMAALEAARSVTVRDVDQADWLHKVIRHIHGTEAGVERTIRTELLKK